MIDPVLKQELTNKAVALLLCCLFNSELTRNEGLALPPWTDRASAFCATAVPIIDTKDYIQRLVNYTQCSRSAFIVAVKLMRRVKAYQRLLAPTVFNMHRLLTVALVIATKTLDDRVYSNDHFARVGGIASTRELNDLETSMLTMLNFNVFVSPKDYAELVHELAGSTIYVIRPKIPVSVQINGEIDSSRVPLFEEQSENFVRRSKLIPASNPISHMIESTLPIIDERPNAIRVLYIEKRDREKYFSHLLTQRE